jgi:hypothetical protein
MKKLYSMREEGLDEYRIGSHKKTGGCEICYDGGVKAIEHYKGGVKVYKKQNPNDDLHIDIASHNIVGGARKKKQLKNYDSDSQSISSCEVERKIGGRKYLDRVNLPSSSMAGGAKKKAVNKLKARSEKVKEIMKKNNISMIEASKYIKANNIKY